MARKSFYILLAIILTGMTLMPFNHTFAVGSSSSATITDSIVNVRSGPGLTHSVVARVQQGETFDVMDTQGDWIKIRVSSVKKGWVANWVVSLSDSKTNHKDSTYTKKESKGIITTNGLRVRRGPGSGYPVEGVLSINTKVDIIGQSGNWIQIQTDSMQGYVSKEYITSMSASSEKYTKKIKSGTITGDLLNVRNSASSTAPVIGKLAKGTVVNVLNQDNNWTCILFKGQQAWVSSEYISVQSNNSLNDHKNTIKVTATSLRVRDSASSNAKQISVVSQNQQFSVLNEKNNWYQIELADGKKGWISSWYTEKNDSSTIQLTRTNSDSVPEGSQITILYDGTNIRSEAGTHSSVTARANSGDTFDVVSIKNDWYEIKLKNGTTGFIAGWLVSVKGSIPQVNKQGAEVYLRGKTIVIDAGHGGTDGGAIGIRGTLEKNLTLRTAMQVSSKLKAAGAKVILTRNNDRYLALSSRVTTSNLHGADAFISIHYDSTPDRSANGITTYYNQYYQQSLAETLHSSVIKATQLKNRGARYGDLHVIRENRQPAILIELGYISNLSEEVMINSSSYQEAVANGFVNGLAAYFK